MRLDPINSGGEGVMLNDKTKVLSLNRRNIEFLDSISGDNQ